MSLNYPRWKPDINRVGNFPYIEGCVNNDVVFFPIVNYEKTRHLYVYMPTNEVEKFIEELKDAIDHNKRVMGIRTQEHTMRWQ